MSGIQSISFDEILHIWTERLWPTRTSSIETHSAMMFGEYPYKYDASYFNNEPSFFGLYVDDILVGVNSGHKTGDSYRSRGLYVFPEYRGNSFGKQLLEHTARQAVVEESTFCWSLPRHTSFSTYASAKFVQVGDWFETETSEKNAYAIINLISDNMSYPGVEQTRVCSTFSSHINP